MRARSSSWVLAIVAIVGVIGCSFQSTDEPESTAPSELAAGAQRITIEPAPEHLQGRVALPAGARVYSRPTFTAPSWSIVLPDPPLASGDDLPRVRAFRVVGIVRSTDGTLGGAGDFVAVTNDLDGEDGQAPPGCGPRLEHLEHLRMLVYVPVVHLAEVTARPLEVQAFARGKAPEHLRLGAGVRVGPARELGGIASEPGSSWRSIDADGIRTLAPIPDDAVGVAWDPGLLPEFGDAGDALFRDAEGSTMWLRDDGGSSVELTLRNSCAEHRRLVDDAAEVESLRALALDAFYDQRPRPEPTPVVEEEADYRIPAGTPLRWPDGDLAGETLVDWSVAIGVGQTWDGRRCFSLPLGGELAAVDAPALACVDPKALELLAEGAGFGVSDELSLGGSIELGPVTELAGGPWDPQALRAILNGRHDTVAECLRPMLQASEGLIGARWDLRLTVTEAGQVDEVELEARGPSHSAVEDCLRAEAFTWLLPQGALGRLEIPVTVGQWTPELDESANSPGAEPGSDKSEPESESEPEAERGKVIIIRDDEPEPEPSE